MTEGAREPETPRDQLAERIAGEVTMSEDPGATMRKWRTDFSVSQTELATELDVSASVVSDYESGRRESPGIGVVSRVVGALLDIDERRGGERIRQYGRVLSAGFESDVVLDLQEYSTTVDLDEIYGAIGATEVASEGRDAVSGHTVIDSINAITRLSSGEFYRLYGQSTNRLLVFSGVTRGESPLVALRVANPTPNAVLLHGIEADDLWEHAPALARMDGYSLSVSTTPLEDLLATLREF